MLTLVLTRHGLTDRSVPEQHLGQHIDIGLNGAGRRQGDALARRIRHVAFDRIVTSPLRRARETAEVVTAASGEGIRLEADPRLAEMDYGRWEGLTYAQVEALDPELRGRWELDPATLACPGGESGTDVAARVRDFLRDLGVAERAARRSAARAMGAAGVTDAPIAPSPGDRTVLVVAHSSLNRILLCLVTGIPIREYRWRFRQDQANLTVLRLDEGADVGAARIVVVNDTAHLRKPSDQPWP